MTGRHAAVLSSDRGAFRVMQQDIYALISFGGMHYYRMNKLGPMAMVVVVVMALMVMIMVS